MNLTKKGAIASVKQIAKRTIEVVIKVPPGFYFRAGQYIWLMVPELKYPDPKGNTRMFSIASSPSKKGELEIVFRTSESGYKRTLVEMTPGSEIIFSGPFGSLELPKDNSSSVVFVAGGVGVTPFLSMIRFSTETNSGHKITLIYANASMEETAYLDELISIEKENSNFKLVKTFDLPDKKLLGEFVSPNILWFVIGPRNFVNSVSALLNQSGVPIKNITFDEFYPDIVPGSSFKEKLKLLINKSVVDDPYLLAVENIDNHIIITDINGVILYANKSAETTTGYTSEEIIGNTPKLWGALMPPDFYKNLWKTIKYDRRMFSAEVKNKRKNQEEYHAFIRISPIIDKDNDLVGFVATEEDITDKKRIDEDLANAKKAAVNVLNDLQIEKEKLAEAKAKEEAILLSVGDGLIATDEKGNITLINKMAEKLFGIKGQESVGKSFFEVIFMEDEKGVSVPLEKRPVNMALAGTTTTGPTYYYVRPDKTKFPAAIIVTPIILDGKIVGTIEVFHDITKEREVDKAKTEFVSLASHQLRTPLTGIEWTIELFSKKEKFTAEGQKYLADIHFSASRLSALIKLLLDVSRIESGNVGVVPEPLDLVELINEYRREHLMLCDKGKIFFIFAQHPEKLMATTDKNLVGFILQNIMANAIEYTQPGGKVEILLEEKQNSVFLVTVRDTGVGIPKTEQARIFEKFVRASNAITIKPDGTGLGLYIVQESVKLLGGKIWFESVEGKGSTFYVELPMVAQPHGGEKDVVLLNQKDKV